MAGISGMIAEKKQGITNAWELADSAVRWLSCIHERLDKVVELTKEAGERDQFHRFVQKVTTDAAGVADALFPGIQGWHYELISIAITSSAGEAGVARTMLNGPHPVGLLHVTALSQYTSDAYPQGTIIPAGVGLDISFSGSVVSSDIYVAVLAKKLPQTEQVITTGGGEV